MKEENEIFLRSLQVRNIEDAKWLKASFKSIIRSNIKMS